MLHYMWLCRFELNSLVKHKEVHAYFLYNGIASAVKIPVNHGSYQIFTADLVKHQTSVQVNFYGKTVRLNDKELFIFA